MTPIIDSSNFSKIAHSITRRVEEIESASNIENIATAKITDLSSIDNKIKTTIKILKRCLKGEKKADHLIAILSLVDRIEKSYKSFTSKILKEPLPSQNSDLKVKRVKAATILHTVARVKGSIQKKVEIIKNDANFPTVNRLPRFDLWVRPNKRTYPNDKHQMALNFLFPLIEAVQLKNGVIRQSSITANSIKFLKDNILGNSMPLADQQDFEEFISLLYKQIAESQANQEALIIELFQDLKNELSSEGNMTEGMKIKYAIQYRQIVNNPFDIKFDELNGVEALKSIIADIDSLVIPYNEHTAQYKLEGLLRLRNQAAKTPSATGENILISGAGPGGLMLALNAALKNKSFEIIESRNHDQKMRENIVALGKEDNINRFPMLQSLSRTGGYCSADVKLLDFFGITDKLISEKKAIDTSKTNFKLLSAKIGDLQIAMNEQVSALVGKSQSLIHYGVEIDRLESATPDQPTTIHFKKSATSDPTTPILATMTPSLVHVMEGYHSRTRSLLGIDLIKESKIARMAYAFFEIKKDESVKEKMMHILETCKNILLAMPSLLKFFLNMKFFNKSSHIEKTELYFKALERASLLLETQTSNYLYFTMSKEEAVLLKECEEALLVARQARQEWTSALDSHLIRLENEELEEVDKKIDKLENQLKKFGKTIALIQNRKLKLISAFQMGHTMGAANYKQTTYATSQVQRAERNYRMLGSTMFYVGGDAESATDPIAGSGLRTTLLRDTLASAAFDDPALRKNRVMHSIFEMTSHWSGRSMREEGLHLRRMYMSGTERIERYLSLAEGATAIDTDDRNFLLQMEGVAKNRSDFPDLNLTLDTKDRERLKLIKDKVYNKYNASVHYQIDWIKTFTPIEREVFSSALEAAKKQEQVSFTKLDREVFKSAAAKVALERMDRTMQQENYHAPEAWFVPLYTTITEYENM